MAKHLRTVLSTFDGISCAQHAMAKAGITYDRYYASEILKPAIQQTQHDFPNTEQLGDIEDWRSWCIDWTQVDLLLGGFPCQGFSMMGKRAGFTDPRSRLGLTLFDLYEYAREQNPDIKFLFENVVMALADESYITRRLGIYPARLDSALVSAQHRERLYWTNFCLKPLGMADLMLVDIPAPADRGITVPDILETERIDFPILSDKAYLYATNSQRFGQYVNTNTYRASTIGRKTWESFTGTLVRMADGRLRRFTIRELARLQTLPDTWVPVISNTEAARAIGNGWSVDTIAYIMTYLN